MQYLLIALGISLAINIAMFLVAFGRKTDKLTDASYAVSFIVLVLYTLLLEPVNAFRLLLAGMVVIWALRLGGFLLFRIWHTGKDGRFDAMRSNFWRFGKFWLLQGLSVWIILIPALLALRDGGGSIGALAIIGFVIWLAGFLLESTADIQKYRFTQNSANKNTWIATGVWRNSRHPNYFGEIIVWVGIYICCLTVLSPLEALVGLVSPLFIKVLLLFVSGVPILEKSADNRWGKQAAYQTYKRQTSVLIPLPRRK